MNAILLPVAPAPTPEPSMTIAPRERASQFHRLIREIEAAMAKSESKVDEISERGVWSNLLSSSRDDLVACASGQNRVNTLLLKLQREAIALNMLGYTYLSCVIAEFERQVNDGVRDSDGNISVLSRKGKEVAQMATEMFNAILDTSEWTQARIAANTTALAEHEQSLGELTCGLAVQAERTASFEQFRLASAQAVEALGRQHGELLDKFQASESERAVTLQSQVTTLHDELSRAGKREACLQLRLQRCVWGVWPAVAVTTGLSLVTCGHAFGWF